ncbi:cupin domain-containing protein [Paenarthrobacter aurescens]|nr:cupin domain-containing protein [Paenarthrobacter aurescens]MDO6142071.1 cupin domain-containing protein [Paenarthrobacter aurescens]MDO6145874.1 cupin domain-containing protein [Paenarthrobacter aurescens]MDO6157120.1 cupin domain-containing protein [Paenarthrobacter aurescens]MDO6161106.1 cupin domain-containing protein [Paenarthrobacter aurescens]
MKSAGVLETRLIDIARERFAGEVWGRTALLSRGVSDFSDVFSAGAVDELVSRRGLRTPFLRVAKGGSTLPESSFTSPAGVGATIPDQLDDTALWRKFADGATLVLQALHRTWDPVAGFTSRLSSELGHPVQANAYITPPQNRGFDDHYDVHDVFVLQIEGTKRWIIHEPVHVDPLRSQPWTDHRSEVAEAAQGQAYIDTVLEPGDVLYLPRGWLHAAQAQGEVSIHLTLGVHNWTRHALAEQLAQAALAALCEDPVMRGSLPLGVDGPEEELAVIRERLAAAVLQADTTSAFQRSRRGQARPAPLGPVAQLAAVQGLGPGSLVRLRDALEARLEGSRLSTRVGWLDFPATDLPSVERLLDGGEHLANDLGIELVERLLRAGVLLPAGN